MGMLIKFSRFTRYITLITLALLISTAAAASGRVTTGLVAYYPFTEGTGKVVSDQSGNAAPTDLVISGAVGWRNQGNGVVMSGGRVGTANAALPITNALQASNTVSIEAWVKPANLTQSGPSRIASLASGTKGQNFMLGQDKKGVHARVMNEAKDVYGRPWLSTSNDVLNGRRVHLVHTFDGAVERLYVDGVLRSETVAVAGGFSNWNRSAKFSIGNESSLDRPFSGAIFLVAVYDRVLGDAEVQQNFSAGFDSIKGDDFSSMPVAPVINGTPDDFIEADSLYRFKPNASDANSDALTFRIKNKPVWASFNPNTGRLLGIPGQNNAGFYGNIVIKVSDGSLSTALPSFSITVEATEIPNSVPTISGSPAGMVTEGDAYSFLPDVSDADGGALTFSVSDLPVWAGFDSKTGRLSGTPFQGDAGNYSNIVIRVSDGESTAALPAFSIVVEPVVINNSAPILSGSPAPAVAVGDSYGFQVSATDADGDKLTFSITNRPSWASFNTTTGVLAGTPSASDQGVTGNIRISVTDGLNVVSLAAFVIRVEAAVAGERVTTGLVAYYPFTEGAGSVVADQSGSGTPMDLEISGSVGWLSAGNGVVMSGGRVGTENTATKVIDSLQFSNVSTFEAWVKPANLSQSGPSRIISLAGGTSKQNFMLGQEQSGLHARLRNDGKNQYAQPWLSTSDNVLNGSLVHLVHTFDGAVDRLYINGVLRSETVEVSGSFSNWDASAVFSIGNESSMNRSFSGSIYLVAVYDRVLGDAEVQQNYSAGSGNTGDGDDGYDPIPYAPVISGTPSESASAGSAYVFQPNASDANGDTLTFSIANKPAWASFDVSTGRLSGTPMAAQEGTYSAIIISVTDALEMVSLPAFSIQVDIKVVAATTGNVDMGWAAPVARADGTALNMGEISGYKIYYGTASGVYSDQVSIGSAYTTSKTLSGLPVGACYLVMTTIDADGRESGYSPEVERLAQ